MNNIYIPEYSYLLSTFAIYLLHAFFVHFTSTSRSYLFLLFYSITFYPISYHSTLSYPITLILPHLILSHLIISHLILSHPISSYPISPYPILSYPIPSNLILSDNSLIATTSGDCSLIVMEVDLDPTRDQPGKLMKRSEGR